MNKIAVVDIETSGFLNQGGLIVEVGIVGLDLDTGEVFPEFNSIVKEKGFGPKHARNPYGWVFQNSDLEYEDVDNAIALDEVKAEIQAVFDKYPKGATAFNKAFDFSFLQSRGIIINELPCAMLSATPVVNLPPNRGFKTPKWPKVEEAWNFFFGKDTGYIEAHRAMDDAKHEALIVYELYKRGAFVI